MVKARAEVGTEGVAAAARGMAAADTAETEAETAEAGMVAGMAVARVAAARVAVGSVTRSHTGKGDSGGRAPHRTWTCHCYSPWAGLQQRRGSRDQSRRTASTGSQLRLCHHTP